MMVVGEQNCMNTFIRCTHGPLRSQNVAIRQKKAGYLYLMYDCVEFNESLFLTH